MFLDFFLASVRVRECAHICVRVRASVCVCVRARGHACVWVCGCPKTHRFGQMPAKTAIDIARIVKLWLFYWNDKSNTFDMTNWLPRLKKSSRWCWCRKCWFCDAHLIEILWRIMAVYHCAKKISNLLITSLRKIRWGKHRVIYHRETGIALQRTL